LDAIEYANGPVKSQWGALRAKNGHPAPFNLKYLEIGNENGGPAYHERYALMYKAIKDRYPEMHLIANEWSGIPKNAPVEIVDEHYYNNPEFFIRQAGRYDTYDHQGHKVYVGEYAVTQNTGKGNLRGAVGEAAFMIGMERNSDVVVMSSYAPLFVHLNHRKWNPDLINYDSTGAYGIPSYYVQQLFGQNRGDAVLPTEVTTPQTEPGPAGGAIGVGTWWTQAEFKDIKVTKGNEILFASDFSQGTKGWRMLGGGKWKAQEGVLRQEGTNDNVRAIFGDAKWSDYTLTLKARKLSGSEGFLILFNVQDDGAKSWWNLGGWGNKRHAIEMGGVIGNEANGTIETGRWYDIRVECKGQSVKCYLDGQLVNQAASPTIKSIYASASKDKATGETIIKVVNTAATALETEIKLNGVTSVTSPATLMVLTSGSSTDENSLEAPKKVATVTSTLNVAGPAFKHPFPGNSVTVIRLKTQ
jgi:alpha-L-arabinofuranosidase